MKHLVIATRNAHKVEEIQAMLPADVRCSGLRGLGDVPEAVEDAPTFAGNALLKATVMVNWLLSSAGAEAASTLPSGWNAVLADDSGLEVDALNGAPGVLSARFAALDTPGRKGNSPDSENNAKLLRLLDSTPDHNRSARFRCALVVVPFAIGEPPAPGRLFEGVCEGRIRRSTQGLGGFGYDPLFVPEGHTVSFAELGSEVKNRLSHRAKALAALNEWIRTIP